MTRGFHKANITTILIANFWICLNNNFLPKIFLLWKMYSSRVARKLVTIILGHNYNREIERKNFPCYRPVCVFVFFINICILSPSIFTISLLYGIVKSFVFLHKKKGFNLRIQSLKIVTTRVEGCLRCSG